MRVETLLSSLQLHEDTLRYVCVMAIRIYSLLFVCLFVCLLISLLVSWFVYLLVS